jgi:hypothetical protein
MAGGGSGTSGADGGGVTKAADDVDGLWKGMTKQHLMSVMLAAREDGRRNRYLPANFQFPLNLACEETKAQGVVLRKGQIL